MLQRRTVQWPQRWRLAVLQRSQRQRHREAARRWIRSVWAAMVRQRSAISRLTGLIRLGTSERATAARQIQGLAFLVLLQESIQASVPYQWRSPVAVLCTTLSISK